MGNNGLRLLRDLLSESWYITKKYAIKVVLCLLSLSGQVHSQSAIDRELIDLVCQGRALIVHQGGSVNIRDEASTSGQVVGTVSNEVSLDINGYVIGGTVNGNPVWLQIADTNNDGEDDFVSAIAIRPHWDLITISEARQNCSSQNIDIGRQTIVSIEGQAVDLSNLTLVDLNSGGAYPVPPLPAELLPQLAELLENSRVIASENLNVPLERVYQIVVTNGQSGDGFRVSALNFTQGSQGETFIYLPSNPSSNEYISLNPLTSDNDFGFVFRSPSNCDIYFGFPTPESEAINLVVIDQNGVGTLLDPSRPFSGDIGDFIVGNPDLISLDFSLVDQTLEGTSSLQRSTSSTVQPIVLGDVDYFLRYRPEDLENFFENCQRMGELIIPSISTLFNTSEENPRAGNFRIVPGLLHASSNIVEGSDPQTSQFEDVRILTIVFSINENRYCMLNSSYKSIGGSGSNPQLLISSQLPTSMSLARTQFQEFPNFISTLNRLNLDGNTDLAVPVAFTVGYRATSYLTYNDAGTRDRIRATLNTWQNLLNTGTLLSLQDLNNSPNDIFSIFANPS